MNYLTCRSCKEQFRKLNFNGYCTPECEGLGQAPITGGAFSSLAQVCRTEYTRELRHVGSAAVRDFKHAEASADRKVFGESRESLIKRIKHYEGDHQFLLSLKKSVARYPLTDKQLVAAKNVFSYVRTRQRR